MLIVDFRILFALFVCLLPAAYASELKLISATAAKPAVADVIAAFEKSTGHKVTATWSGTEGVSKRVADGEVFDVVIVAAPNIDRLAQAGRLVADSRTDFARTGVGVAVRAGLPRPDIATPEALRRAVLAASSVAYSAGPSGFHVAEVFKRLGITEQVQHKVRQSPSGVQVGDLLARGEVDLGFQQMSELAHFKGIEYLGPLPAEVQNITVYSAGLHATAPAVEAARLLMKMLVSPEGAAIVRRSGMDAP